MVPRIDHVVLDARDWLHDAAQRYRALGFHLIDHAPNGEVSLNHRAMFDEHHLELLCSGTREPTDTDLPVGLNGLVFATDCADNVYAEQRVRGTPVQAVQHVSGSVQLPDGQCAETRCDMVHLEPRLVFDGRVSFCEHLTRAQIWQPDLPAHPNGAVALDRLVISAQDPARVVAGFEQMFDAGAVEAPVKLDQPAVLWAGDVAIEIWSWNPLARKLGAAMPDPAGRAAYLALVSFCIRSSLQTEAVLRRNHVHDVRFERGRILVPAIAAMNVAVEFVI